MKSSFTKTAGAASSRAGATRALLPLKSARSAGRSTPPKRVTTVSAVFRIGRRPWPSRPASTRPTASSTSAPGAHCIDSGLRRQRHRAPRSTPCAGIKPMGSAKVWTRVSSTTGTPVHPVPALATRTSSNSRPASGEVLPKLTAGAVLYWSDEAAYDTGEYFSLRSVAAYALPKVFIFDPSISGTSRLVDNQDFGDSSYTYWNAGLSLCGRKFTFDFRYWDTDITPTTASPTSASCSPPRSHCHSRRRLLDTTIQRGLLAPCTVSKHTAIRRLSERWLARHKRRQKPGV